MCLAAQSQTTYHFHKEVASTGYNLLSTAGPDSSSTMLTTSDLKQKTGSTWIANWATATGVPNSAGMVPANSTFQLSLWMNKSASFGTIYPVVTVGKLDASQNTTAWATARRSVTGLSPTSTIRARPAASRWVRCGSLTLGRTPAAPPRSGRAQPAHRRPAATRSDRGPR